MSPYDARSFGLPSDHRIEATACVAQRRVPSIQNMIHLELPPPQELDDAAYNKDISYSRTALDPVDSGARSMSIGSVSGTINDIATVSMSCPILQDSRSRKLGAVDTNATRFVAFGDIEPTVAQNVSSLTTSPAMQPGPEVSSLELPHPIMTLNDGESPLPLEVDLASTNSGGTTLTFD
jgi:hypothetical protein